MLYVPNDWEPKNESLIMFINPTITIISPTPARQASSVEVRQESNHGGAP